jgi:hypothetical protein
MSLDEVLFLLDLLDISGERVADGDTAHVDSSGDLEETLVSPVGTPGVLNDPVVLAILITVSNGKHSMVNITSGVLAGIRGVNTSGIVSETIDDLEGNGNWTMPPNSRLEIFLITLSDVDRATLNSQSEGRFVNSAVVILGEVRIVFLGGDSTNLGDVLEGVGR